MSRIVELIEQFCPDGVEFKDLNEICNSITTGKLNANAMVENGQYPFFTCDEKQFKIDKYAFDTEAILISGNGSQVGHINYYKGKFNAYQRTYVLSNFSQNISIRFFLFYAKAYLRPYILRHSKKGSVPYITLPMLQSFNLPIPPLEIQNEIVRILDTFTTLEAELEAELEARKKQYSYYRDNLLNFEGKEVDWKVLGDVCLMTENIKWKDHHNKEFMYIDLSSVSRENNKIYETQSINSKSAPSRAQQIVLENDVVFGTTRPTLKRYALITAEYHNQICSTGFCVLRANRNIVLPSFLFFILKTNTFFEYVENNQEGAGYPSISNSKVKQFRIPVPPMPEQERIVSILNKFDALVNDISTGLPAEIQARKKQYEHYRNLLLTFKNVNNE